MPAIGRVDLGTLPRGSPSRGSARPRCGSSRRGRRSRRRTLSRNLPQPMHLSISMVMPHQCSAALYFFLVGGNRFAASGVEGDARGAGQDDEFSGRFECLSAIHVHHSSLKLRAVRLVALRAGVSPAWSLETTSGERARPGRIGLMAADAKNLGSGFITACAVGLRCARRPVRDTFHTRVRRVCRRLSSWPAGHGRLRSGVTGEEEWAARAMPARARGARQCAQFARSLGEMALRMIRKSIRQRPGRPAS